MKCKCQSSSPVDNKPASGNSCLNYICTLPNETVSHVNVILYVAIVYNEWNLGPFESFN